MEELGEDSTQPKTLVAHNILGWKDVENDWVTMREET